MSIFQKIFGAAAAPAPAPAAPGVTNNVTTNPAPNPPASSAVTAPNGTVPADGAKGPAGSPEDKFAGLWEPTPTPDPKPGDGDSTLTPEKIHEAASKVDFSRVLDQDSLKKIAEGGEGAMQALATLLNKTAQTTYAQSITVANKMIETQVNKAREEFTSQLPNLVKKQTMQDSLLSENPAFKKPSVAPVVAAIQAQLAEKHPNATASELNQLAKEFLKAAAEDFNPTPKNTGPVAGKDFVDWDEYMS